MWFDHMGLLAIFAMSLSLLLAATVAGFLMGRRRTEDAGETEKTHLMSVEAAVLGLLALLLGFSFAMAVTRYETRRVLVLQEANAIGTAMLRTRFLVEPYRTQSRAIIRRYIDLRLEAPRYVDYGESRGLIEKTRGVQDELWDQVTQLMRADDKSLANSLFAQIVNTLIDTYAERTAALRALVPGAVMFVLHVLAVFVVGVMGYVQALTARKSAAVPVIVATLIVVVMTLIVDLDRPREGLVTTNQQSMVELKQAIELLSKQDAKVTKVP